MNTKHLKAKILDLAIRGKLVPQDSSEGNSADLLQKIREEKKAVVEALETTKQKKIKEDKNASFIIKADDGKHYEQFADGTLKDIEDEIPFQIPENWCWCKLKDVCKEISDLDHRMPKPFPNGIPYISPLDFTKDGKIDLKSAKKVSLKDYEDLSKKSRPEKGDIIFPRYGTIGKIRCIDFEEPCLVSYSCATIKVNLHSMNNEYIKYVLNSPLIQIDEIQKYINETTQANVGLQSIKDFKFPLPPLSEQKRIVSAIERAFEQIDIIEKNKLSLKTYIKQTKSKVLDLAIHGKLVEQNPQEGNAFELLEKIRNEKTELIKQKKIKEDTKTAKSAASFIIKADDGKHYEQFSDGSLKDIEEEIPFEIPENWCWCRLTSICDYGKCKNSAPSELLPDSWILDLEDIEKGTGKIKKFVNFSERNSLSTKHVFTKGDILYSKLRPYLNKVVIAPKDGFCTSEILPLDFNGVYINNFAQRLLMSPYFLSTVNMLTYGVKMPRLGTDEANQILLPLPPLSEQKRIVSKIEQVFEQLDVLEKSVGE